MENTLTRWTMPKDYFGEEWPEYFAFLGQHRDSECLGRANFTAGLDALGGESDTVIVVRENHWAVGWVEWIAIHETDTDSLAKASSLNAALEDYPVLDEGLFSKLENEECALTWECFDAKDRTEYLRKHLNTIKGNFRQLLVAVKGSWYDAANLLPCPSEILY